MAAELFKMMAGVDLVHVPYHSSFMPDLINGRVQVAFTPIPLTISSIRAGQVRAIAVTSKTTADALPGIPPIAQFVPGYEATIWHGIAAPKGTPEDIVDKLHTEINAVLTDPAIKPKFDNVGAVPSPMSRAAFVQYINAEVGKWAKVIKFADIKPS
jgi:tripartite-type tricarboxylate transporter receptor subunit TctC